MYLLLFFASEGQQNAAFLEFYVLAINVFAEEIIEKFD
jgi:hypothetical protein